MQGLVVSYSCTYTYKSTKIFWSFLGPVLEVPLYTRKRTQPLYSIQTKWLVPMCPLLRGSTVHIVHKEEDSPSKWPGVLDILVFSALRLD